MSKMSQLHAELTQQAAELGFMSIEEAEANGYHIDYTSKGWKLKLDMAKAHEEAHKAWLEEKEKVLEEQEELHDHLMELGYDNLAESVWHAITFIKEAHD